MLNVFEITHRWANVQSSSQSYNYLYPTVVSPYMKEQYCRPTVYRWRVWTPGYGIYAFYVGETDNLAIRIQHCLRPGNTQATNLRLKAYFDEAVNQKQQVELETLAFDPFQINKVNFSVELLGHTHIRRMLENLVLVLLDAQYPSGPPVILNRILEQDKKRSNKRIDSALSHLKQLGLTNEQTVRLLETLKIRRAYRKEGRLTTGVHPSKFPLREAERRNALRKRFIYPSSSLVKEQPNRSRWRLYPACIHLKRPLYHLFCRAGSIHQVSGLSERKHYASAG